MALATGADAVSPRGVAAAVAAPVTWSVTAPGAAQVVTLVAAPVSAKVVAQVTALGAAVG